MTDTTAAARSTFEDMRLKVGDRLQLEPGPGLGQVRYMVRLLGFLEGHSLMVQTPQPSAGVKPLVEGDGLVVRVFSGQGAFGFRSFVERVIRNPFDYLHLKFPERIEGVLVRKAPRVRTDISARVRPAAGGETEARIVNLSASGLLLESPAALGDPGSNLQIRFDLLVFGNAVTLDLQARVRAGKPAAAEAPEGPHQHGIELIDPAANDTLNLQAFVHQTLVENPHSLV